MGYNRYRTGELFYSFSNKGDEFLTIMEQTVIGQYNSAKVFTDVVEQSALDQIRTLCD